MREAGAGYDVGLERGRFRLVGLTLAALLPFVACALRALRRRRVPSLPPLPSLTVPVSPCLGPVPVGPTPIPSVALGAPPSYEGAPADPQPVRGPATVPQNRFMAPNGESEIHDDGWQTDAFAWSGPLGRSPQTLSSYLAPGRDCGSIAFDSHGRVVSICISTSGPELYMFDPSTLATLATFSLPLRTPEDAPAEPEHLPGLLQRRLLLPRQPRPGRHRHDHAAHLRDRGDRGRRGLCARARLRPVLGAHVRGGDHLGAAGLE